MLILLLCWLPRIIVEEIEGRSPWFQIPDLDKAIHAGIFVVLAILWRPAYFVDDERSGPSFWAASHSGH